MAVRHHRRRRSRSAGRRRLLGLGVTGAGLAAVAVAVTAGVGQVTAGQPCTTTHRTSAMSLAALAAAAPQAGLVSGIATHYVLQGGGGNCSYAGPPSDGLYVALSPAEYDSAGACGGYLEVTGPDGSVRVKVIDQCPECATGHLDLSEAAFSRISPLRAGLISVHYTYLSDPALPGPIAVEVKNGSSRYWLSLVIDNTGNPLASVQVQIAAGSWLSLSRASYNAWNSQSGAGPGPFTVRLTDTAGNQAAVPNITLSPGSVQSTGTSMYGAGSAPAPAPAAAAVPTARSASPSPSASPRGSGHPAATASATAARRPRPPAGAAITPAPVASASCS